MQHLQDNQKTAIVWSFSVYPCWMLKCKQGGQEKEMELRIADDSIPWKFRKSI